MLINLYLQLKNDDTATFDKPPHHHLFNMISNNNLGQQTALLKHRQQTQNQKNSKHDLIAQPPAIHFNVSSDVFHAFQNPAGSEANASLANSQHVLSSMLLPAGHFQGPQLTLDEFCALYSLSDRVKDKLDENGYSGSHTFHFVELQDLKDGGFKVGEIAQLKDAISQWSMDA